MIKKLRPDLKKKLERRLYMNHKARQFSDIIILNKIKNRLHFLR